jgi:hypothetical protein
VVPSELEPDRTDFKSATVSYVLAVLVSFLLCSSLSKLPQDVRRVLSPCGIALRAAAVVLQGSTIVPLPGIVL